LTNLLSNALRYAPSGPIVVSLVDLGDHFRIAVADRGPGMSPEEIDRIWERFYRGSAAQEAGSRGFGLGLAIVRHIVELHGGHVSVTSRQGDGATFAFDLPIGVRGT
jgi:signal transduction histidine kinase